MRASGFMCAAGRLLSVTDIASEKGYAVNTGPYHKNLLFCEKKPIRTGCSMQNSFSDLWKLDP